MDSHVNHLGTNGVLARSGFQSAKTIGRIPYPSRWHKIALVALTLDPSVETIAPGGNPTSGKFSVTVEYVDRTKKTVIFVDDRDQASPETIDPRTIDIRLRSDFFREPKLGNLRAIWSAHSSVVNLRDRLNLLAAVEASQDGLSLGRIFDLVKTDVDLLTVLSRLVCDGEIAMNFEVSIDLETKLLRRRNRSNMGESNSLESMAQIN